MKADKFTFLCSIFASFFCRSVLFRGTYFFAAAAAAAAAASSNVIISTSTFDLFFADIRFSSPSLIKGIS